MKLPASLEPLAPYKAELILCGILVLSAFLNIWNIWTGGFSNTYYAAAVRSTLVNPVAGFFNSLDPAGFITIDKPPVGLWVQALFAAVLGFSGWSIILPQALAGVGSVALLYFIVSRPFGKPAGLVAALALAVTPIVVAVSRNGTMDMQMIFVVLLAVGAALKAARERSLPWLIAAVVLVGIGFNIKMIQAFIVVPAVLAVYFLGAADLAWKKRILHIGLAIVVLLTVSLSWALVVDSIPADQRPFIGGSDDNTVLGLIINYNGAHRLGISTGDGGSGGSPGSVSGGMQGQGTGNSTMAAPGSTGTSSTGPGSGPGSSGSSSSSSNAASSQGPGNSPGSSGSSASTSGAGSPPGMEGNTGSSGSSSSGPTGGMGGGGGNGNSQGIFRLFQSDLAGDIAWLLPFALIGVLAWVRRPKTLTLTGITDAGYLGEKGLTLLAMLLWLVPGLLYFSFTSGFWHDYYIATLAPPLAALVGIGAVGMYRHYVSGSRAAGLLVIAVLVTGLVQAWFLTRVSGFAGSLVPLVLCGTLACTALLAVMLVNDTEFLTTYRTRIIAIAIGILFIAPLAWSCTLLPGGNSGNIPSASLSGSQGGMGDGMPGGSGSGGMTGSGGMSGSGTGPGSVSRDNSGFGSQDGSDRAGNGGTPPSSLSGTGGSGPGGASGTAMPGGSNQGSGPGTMGGSGGSSSSDSLAEYLLSHTTNETWILAVSSSHEGSDLIIQTGKPVMCLGGFTGADTVLNVSSVQTYIREGKVRFFQTGGTGGGSDSGSGNSAIFSWVAASCKAVSTTGSTESGNQTASSSSLYDCKGAAGTV